MWSYACLIWVQSLLGYTADLDREGAPVRPSISLSRASRTERLRKPKIDTMEAHHTSNL